MTVPMQRDDCCANQSLPHRGRGTAVRRWMRVGKQLPLYELQIASQCSPTLIRFRSAQPPSPQGEGMGAMRIRRNRFIISDCLARADDIRTQAPYSVGR